MSIKTNMGYRCPKCNYAWSSYTKDYNGYVYCGNNKCNHKFKNRQIKITTYSFFESFSNKEQMINELEKYLNELKSFDNKFDNNVCEE